MNNLALQRNDWRRGRRTLTTNRGGVIERTGGGRSAHHEHRAVSPVHDPL